MNIFHFKKIIFLLLLSLFILSLTFFKKSFKQDPFTKQSYFLIAESHVLLSSLQTYISDYIKKYLFLLNLRKKNKLLTQENNHLQIQLQTFQDTLKENERLRQMMDFPQKQQIKLIAAQVISYDFLSRKHILIVNKGSSHGIKKFMGVLHPDGVVGFVFRVSRHSSQVITLEHPLAVLPVRNRKNRELGLLFSSINQIKLHFLSQNPNFDTFNKSFKQGDTLITTQSNQFPSGFLVGQVNALNFSKDQGFKQKNPEVIIQPFVKFDSIEELFILLEPFTAPFPKQKEHKDAR